MALSGIITWLLCISFALIYALASASANSIVGGRLKLRFIFFVVFGYFVYEAKLTSLDIIDSSVWVIRES